MRQQRPLLLLILIAYMFSPSILGWATNPHDAWYKPYILWALVVAVAFALAWRKPSL